MARVMFVRHIAVPSDEPVFLAQGRTRAVLLLALTLVLATLLPDLLDANPDGQPWVVSWYQRFVSKVDAISSPDAQGAWVSWNLLNQSLSGTMYRLFTPIAAPLPAAIAAQQVPAQVLA